ncbi:MAG: class I SAM-dependent methyltransferase family protein [Methanobacteriaceae archaeon]|nr:class I SAM-dependent methyltransferase family protein [Methanobacteriaceae archaeon]
MHSIKTPKKQANDIIKELRKNKQINYNYKIKHEENHIIIPLQKTYSHYIIQKIQENYPDIELLSDITLQKQTIPPQNFTEYLNTNIDKEKLDKIHRSFDIIGNTVIIEIPEELEKEKYQIAEAILKFTKRQNVYNKKSKIQGITRTRKLEHLVGTKNPETIHKEFNLKFKLNIETVYFSPRLATERKRIVEQVKENETIIDFFAGIGSFPISIANKKETKIYSVDINPEAYKYMQENIKLNKLKGNIIPIQSDINKIIDELPPADRIIMNLPGTAKEFLPLAIEKIKKPGIINYYEFTTDPQNAIESIKKINKKYNTKILNVHKVRSQGPKVWHVAVDAQIF